MVRHNNMIPSGHFHKKWQRYVKLWFDQPFKKVKRNKMRVKKANKLSPRPVGLLRPIVRCPSVRYNTKQRLGRGFTFQELEGAGINKKYAKTIGIAVEHRRRNKSHESLQQNVLRLQDYMSRLIVYPLGKKILKQAVEKTVTKGLNNLRGGVSMAKARVPTDEEKKFNVYATLRNARNEQKRVSRKLKRKNKEVSVEVVSK